MGAIYTKSDGTQVYDNAGQTINAKTGMPYAPAVAATPPAPAAPPVTAPVAPTPSAQPVYSPSGGAIIPQAPAPTAPPVTAPPGPAAPPTAPAGSTTSNTYVTIPTANGPTYFMQTSAGLAAVTDQNIVAQLKSGALSASSQPAISGGADRFANPSTPPAATIGSGGNLSTNTSTAVGPTIPSTAVGSGSSSSELLSRAQQIYDQFKGYNDQLLAASTPSAEETAATAQIRALNTKLAQGIAKVGSQAIPEPLIGLQSQKLQSQIASVIKPLQDELDTLVQARSTRVDAITRVMQGSSEMLQMLGNIQKLTQPNVLGTQVNQTTGDVYAFVQDANGGVSSQMIGNVGSNNTGKTYTQSGTYQGGDGTYFYGVKPDGTIDNIKMQGTNGGSSAGFTLSPGQTRYNPDGTPVASAPGNGPANFKFSQPQTSQLLSGGLSSSDITALQSDVASYGLEQAVQGLPTNQQNLVRRVLAGSDTVSDQAGNKQYIDTNFLGTLFTEEQLQTAAADAGYRHWYSSWATEKANYLAHLMDAVNQYRAAGKTDDEILKLMQ